MAISGVVSFSALCASPSFGKNFAELEGHWSWRGYNRIVTISDTGYSANAVTEVSCLPIMEGELIELSKLIDRVSVIDDNRFTAADYYGINRYTFDRIDALPPACTSPPVSDAEYVFEVFWRYFQDNYAFFDVNGVDWQARYEAHRARVTRNTTNDELFEILSGMLTGFNDAHVNLVAGTQAEALNPDSTIPFFNAGRPSPSQQVFRNFYEAQKSKPDGIVSEYAHRFAFLFEINGHLRNETLKGNYDEAANGLILWSEVAPGVGYVAVHAMAALFSDQTAQDAAKEVAGIESVLDEDIMPFLADKEAVIFDVRFNTGGHDAVSMAIASRFADRSRLAFSKAVRNRSGELPAQEIRFGPDGPLQFTKPIYLLTSSFTASAAEIFTLSMMTLPYVTRVGMPTNGIFSDQWPAPLPNGWMISLSNEVYETSDGVVYEGRGIPPQVEAPVFVPGAFWNNVDAAYDAALELAKQR